MSGLYERQLVALGRALQKVRELEYGSDITQAVIDYLQQEFDYAFIWLGVYNSVTHTIVGQGGVTPASENAILTQKFALEPGELLEQVVVQKRLIGIPNVQDVPKGGKIQAIARQLNVQGTVIFPIRHRDECLGIAVLSSTVWGIPVQSDDKARLSMILGEFGTALHRLESQRQEAQSQRPMTALLTTLSTIHQTPESEEQLAVLVREAHQFLRGDRTYLYWFSPEHRAFWRWIGQPGDRRQAEPDMDLGEMAVNSTTSAGMAAIRQNQATLPAIPVDAIAGLYSQLLANELVTISEAESSLQAGVARALMIQMGATSLAIVPIFWQTDLLGFVAVSEAQARLWSDDDKQYLRGVGQLAALLAPMLDPEQAIANLSLDQTLTAGICQAICSQEDWRQVLHGCANKVQERFESARFFVLSYNEQREIFDVVYQSAPPPRQAPLPSPFPNLGELDWSLLERTQTAVAIEDLGHDLRLMDWRPLLADAGLGSLLICPVTLGNPVNGIVAIAHDGPRHWTTAEKSIGQLVSQQVGVLLRQYYLNNEVEQRQSIHQAVHGSLSTIQKTDHLGEMETSSMNRVVDLMDVPLVALVPWGPDQASTMVPSHLVVGTDVGFSINTAVPIPIATDALVQWALQSPDILSLHVDQLPPETRQWLDGDRIGQVLAVVLRTDPNHSPLGLLLVADVSERFWANYHLEVLEVVGRQLAWSRRSLMLTEKLSIRQEELAQLNWYKHRSLEYLCWSLSSDVRRLGGLAAKANESAARSSGSGQAAANAVDMKSVRSQQILRHMTLQLGTMRPVVQSEQWQMTQVESTVALVSLLKRAMARVEPLIKQRKLWTKVHNDLNLSIIGDITKTELVLHDILAIACRRAPVQSNLDVWCRAIDFNWVELSITDQGQVDAALLDELHNGRPIDKLSSSLLDTAPGLELSICQAIVQKIGGQFNLFSLEDGRTLSQMTLRIHHAAPSEGTVLTQTVIDPTSMER